MADVDPVVLREFEAALDQVLPGPAKAAKKALVSVFKRTTSQGKLSSALEAEQVHEARQELIADIRNALSDDFKQLESRHDQLMNIFIDHVLLASKRPTQSADSPTLAMLALVEADIQKQAEFSPFLPAGVSFDIPYANSNYLNSAEALTESLHLGFLSAQASFDEEHPEIADTVKQAMQHTVPLAFRFSDYEHLTLKLNCLDGSFTSQILHQFFSLGHSIYRLAFLDTGKSIYADQDSGGVADLFDDVRDELLEEISNALESLALPPLRAPQTHSSEVLRHITSSAWAHFAKRSRPDTTSRPRANYGQLACTTFTIGLEAALHTIIDSGDLQSRSIWDDFAPGSRAAFATIYSREELFYQASSVGLKCPIDRNLSKIDSHYLDLISSVFLRDIFGAGGLLSKVLMTDIVLARTTNVDDVGVAFLLNGRLGASRKLIAILSLYGLDAHIPDPRPGQASATSSVIRQLDRMVAVIHRDLRLLTS